MSKRVLFLATTTGYQTRMFGEAAKRLDVELVFATDRCDHLDDPWADSAIAVRFHQEVESVDAIVRALADRPPDAILVVGDRATVIAALVAERLRLPGHPAAAAAAARDKRQTRHRLKAAGLRVPWFTTMDSAADPRTQAHQLTYPVVIKPLTLSGSRGVIRANSPEGFVAAFERLARLLHAPDVRAMRDDSTARIQVETFIDGPEYALEGLLHFGRLQTLAVFDKPDPLDGPFFEETIYVTPSRAEPERQRAIVSAVQDAVAALGLRHGPIHAECRVNASGVYVLEVAARPIGGLCAKALTFESNAAEPIGLEELLLRHALGADPDGWRREPGGSGVMMIPIPRPGVFRRVDGVDSARAVAGVTDVQITAKPDQQLVPLPEGSSYLGFIFARAERPELVEDALREAHARLAFVIDKPMPIARR